ncbi:sigma factor-like helix-turn-helix DNA-binding protein [Bacillus smithii]|uniref:sigma factor-like helix-turn-helix DNA-binding protein n=1 Tax=Bacillus smithii TaxID=1479 RepID=UPI003D1E4319
MLIMKNYADLERMIHILETQIEMLEVDLDFWFGKGEYVPFQSKGAKYGIHVAAENTDRILEKLNQLTKMLDYYKELKKDMDDYINSLEGLEYKIAYKRYVENKTYQEIAKELGYSYGYVRNVMSKAGKNLFPDGPKDMTMM